MALVEVRPIKKPVWFKNQEARALIKPIKISCAVDSRTRKYSFPATEDEIKDLAIKSLPFRIYNLTKSSGFSVSK